MTITLSPKIKKEVYDLLEKYGYESEKDFIEDALSHRILELKRSDFLSGVRKIREEIVRKGLKEKDVLEGFDRYYHK